MKKLALLFCGGLLAAPSFAQYANNSIVFRSFQDPGGKVAANVQPVNRSHAGTANKTTGGPKAAWFSYVNIMAGSSVTGGYYNTYNDSTVKSSATTFVKSHGWGFSFDPYSKVWTDDFVDINSVPGFVMSDTLGYTIDSISFSGRYNRVKNSAVPDTLFFDLVKMGGAKDGISTFTLQSGPSAANAGLSTDSTLRFNTGTYDPANNKMSDSIGTDKISWYILLNAAFFADSSSGGSHSQSIVVPNGGLSVARGDGAMIYMHYKAGTPNAFGASTDTTNMWRQFSFELNGANSTPFQVKKESNCGMVSTWESRYAPYYIPFQGHKMIIPTLFYDATAANDYPEFDFHVKCADCENVGVKPITGIIGSVKAYPNPAGSNAALSVTLSKAANVQVSLINTLGQQVAAQDLGKTGAGQTATANFSTGSLPAGIYVYTVNADGQRMTGRIVITH